MMNTDTGEYRPWNLVDVPAENEILIAGTERQVYFVSNAIKEKRRRDAKVAKKSRKKNRKK